MEALLLQKHSLILEQHALVIQQQTELSSQKDEIENLKLLVAKLMRMQSGRSSEKLNEPIRRIKPIGLTPTND